MQSYNSPNLVYFFVFFLFLFVFCFCFVLFCFVLFFVFVLTFVLFYFVLVFVLFCSINFTFGQIVYPVEAIHFHAEKLRQGHGCYGKGGHIKF